MKRIFFVMAMAAAVASLSVFSSPACTGTLTMFPFGKLKFTKAEDGSCTMTSEKTPAQSDRILKSSKGFGHAFTTPTFQCGDEQVTAQISCTASKPTTCSCTISAASG